MTVLAIVPTDKELDALILAFADAGNPVDRIEQSRVRHHVVRNFDAELALGGLGKTQFAVHTQYLATTRSPQLVVCAGAAGALVDTVAIGDVVVATETVEHDIRKASRSMVPRFPGDSTMLASLRSSPWTAGVRVHFGGIASGDEDIVTHERRHACHQLTDAIAVAWEGAGGARACAFLHVPLLEIRGVADQADGNGPRDFSTNLLSAVANVGHVLRVVAEHAR